MLTEMEDIETRLKKAINFFRKFDIKSDSPIYRKSVIRFCDLVEAYIDGNQAEKIFKGE